VGATPDNLSITANNTPSAVTYDIRGRVTGAQSITPGWVGAVAVADVVTFGAVFFNSSPGYFQTNSTSFVDVHAVAVTVPSGTHYIKVDSAMDSSMSAGSCSARLVLDSTQIGNETYSENVYAMHSLTAGGFSISPGNHTIHLQIKNGIGGVNYCTVLTRHASISGLITPN